MASEQGDDNDDSHISNEEDTVIMPWNLLKQRDYHFEGTTDPDVYFEWEHKMNEFFISCNFLEFEKVFIAAAQLIEQAQQWWSRETTKGCQNWEEMRNRMRKQYVPRDHYQKIRRQFRTLHQGDETIMEYYRKFTYLRIRLNPGVSNEDIMDQFVYGLGAQIRFTLQSQAYTNLEELYEQTAQAEQDLRTNPFEEGENDEDIQPEPDPEEDEPNQEGLQVSFMPNKPLTRAASRSLHRKFNGVVRRIMEQLESFYTIQRLPRMHHYMPKLSRYKEPPTFPHLAKIEH